MNEKIFDGYIEKYDTAFNDCLYDKENEIDFIESTLIENENYDVDSTLNLDKELIRFYSVIKSWKLKWETKETCDIELEGTFNIAPYTKLLIDDSRFFSDEYPQMKNFTLLDYFWDDAAVGFYLDKPEKGLFLYRFDADPLPLYLDFKGYLEMLKYTKAVAFWQYIAFDPNGNLAKEICEKTNKLFPDFTKEGFLALYESLRINR